MTELEKLIEQRKEIDQKIKELKNRSVKIDDTRLNYKTKVACYDEVGTWTIDIFTVKSDELKFRSYKPKWVTVILAPTKDEAIERLHDLIIRLSRLYCKLTGKYLNEEANDD